MKKFTQIVSLAFAVLLLISSFCACKRTGTDETTTPQSEAGTSDEVTENVDEKGFLKDSLPSDLNYGKTTVNVLHWNAERPEFESLSEDPTGDNVSDAIWGRNIAIQERLGVTLKFEEKPGDTKYCYDFVSHVENAYNAGGHSYDLIAAYSRTAGVLVTRGLFLDMNSVEDSYVDLDKPWWPPSIAENVRVGNSLYYISGDASTNTLHMMYGVYYNKGMLTDLSLPDPATEYVEQKRWTLDKLMEMTKNLYEDYDHDGAYSVGDKFGMSTSYFHVDSLYTGSGLKLIERTDDDTLLRVSPDFTSQKAILLVDKLGAWLTGNDCFCELYTGSTAHNENIFSDGRALFVLNRVFIADNAHWCGLNNVDWVYGLVPTPMYDEHQTDYITVLGNPFTLYGIMATAPDPVMVSAVIECWGSEAYRRTSPEVFEVNMKYKYTQEDVSARMFDILRRTTTTDMGRIYGKLMGPNMSEMPSNAASQGRPWATLSKTYQKVLIRQLSQIADAYGKLR